MKTKIFLAMACGVMLQVMTASAQISTSVNSDNNGATLSISIGTNNQQTKPTLNTNYSCCNNNNSNNYCDHDHHHTCNSNANCCGQKHGDKKHHHKKHDHHHHDHDHNNTSCCNKHDD